MNTTDYFVVPQFRMDGEAKQRQLLEGLNWLTQHHYQRSDAYKRLLDRSRGGGPRPFETIDQVPYLPVSLFKTHRLQSVADTDIRNMLTSSGTSGKGVSRIAVDAETAELQNRALASIVKTVIGNERLPMLLADTNAVIRDPALMTARGAGIVGFMRFGRGHTFILDEDMAARADRLHDFLARHGDRPFMIFGFTFMVWQYLYEVVRKGSFDLSKGILMHSGGWKKLESMSVDNATFRQCFADACGLTQIYNFYGMVEQLGSIFVEGQGGLLYPPDFAEVIIRDPATWIPAKDGTTGVIQVLSLLPRSYPGHSLLTEDLGVVTTLKDHTTGAEKRGLKVVGLEESEPLRDECRHFLDSIAAGISPRTDGREGMAVLSVLEAGQRSLETRTTVRLDEITTRPSASLQMPEHFVHPLAVVDDHVSIGKGTRIWHFSHILKDSRIGTDCIIGQNACIGPNVVIGDRCKLQNNVSVYPGVTLEDGVFCGPSCVFTNVMNPRAEIERKNEFLPTLVKRGATIGANATIVCGTTLGEYCFIAAGAVVTKDVPAFAMMAGVPARHIGWVSHAGERLEKDFVCPREGRRYRLVGPEHLEEIEVAKKEAVA